MRPSTSRTLPLATGSAISARVIFSRRVLPVFGSRTPIVTSVPSGPLILAVATSLSTPAIESPSTETTISPTSIPARSAGERLKTWPTLRPFLTGITESPIPENLPAISSWNFFRLSGEK